MDANHATQLIAELARIRRVLEQIASKLDTIATKSR